MKDPSWQSRASPSSSASVPSPLGSDGGAVDGTAATADIAEVCERPMLSPARTTSATRPPASTTPPATTSATVRRVHRRRGGGGGPHGPGAGAQYGAGQTGTEP